MLMQNKNQLDRINLQMQLEFQRIQKIMQEINKQIQRQLSNGGKTFIKEFS
jgi:hypothetical protein